MTNSTIVFKASFLTLLLLNTVNGHSAVSDSAVSDRDKAALAMLLLGNDLQEQDHNHQVQTHVDPPVTEEKETQESVNPGVLPGEPNIDTVKGRKEAFPPPFDLSEQDQAQREQHVDEDIQSHVATGEPRKNKRKWTRYSNDFKRNAVAAWYKRKKSITQKAFAEKIGINENTLGRWIKQYPFKRIEVSIPTYQQGQNLDDKFFTIMEKEGRLLKPHQLDVSKEEEATQEQSFLYKPLGDAGQESIKLVVRDYQLPGIETGGPGIAPVATLVATAEENGLAILTDKITGEYVFIPRAKDGGSWEKKQNTGYHRFIKGLQTKYSDMDIKDSVMAFVPNWIKPTQLFILYEDKATASPHLNYKCRQYQFKDEEYPEEGDKIEGFKDCSEAKRKLGNEKVATLRHLNDTFPIEAATGSLRKEVAAAVSEDQAFFYFRQTSQPQSFRPIIQSKKSGPWEIAVQDLNEQRVIGNRESKLSNVYIEKRVEDIDLFVTGIMPMIYSPDKPNSNPVKAYFKKCPDSNTYCRYLNLDDAAAVRKHFEKLKDQPFNFPLTHFQSVTEPSPLTSSAKGPGKRSSSEMFPSERATKRPRTS